MEEKKRMIYTFEANDEINLMAILNVFRFNKINSKNYLHAGSIGTYMPEESRSRSAIPVKYYYSTYENFTLNL